jgi:anti-anti-sigma regulatory factor
VQRLLITRIFMAIQAAALCVLPICALLMLLPAAPRLLLGLLIGIIIAEVGLVLLGKRLLRRRRDIEAIKTFLIGTIVLAFPLAFLLNSRSILVGAVMLLLAVTIILADRTTTVLLGSISIVLFVVLTLIQDLESSAMAWLGLNSATTQVVEVVIVAAILIITVSFLVPASGFLSQAIADATTLAASSVALHASAVESNRRMAEQIAEQQRLLEVVQTLEAPLIPVRQGVLVLPLVSYLDAHRLDLIEARLLQASHTSDTGLVILEMTGVPLIDADTAQRLLKLAQAVRLIGARTALTGIQPRIARTIAAHAIDLREISTYATIEDALAAEGYA